MCPKIYCVSQLVYPRTFNDLKSILALAANILYVKATSIELPTYNATYLISDFRTIRKFAFLVFLDVRKNFKFTIFIYKFTISLIISQDWTLRKCLLRIKNLIKFLNISMF